jgi:uncharacterized protein (TIGR00255 family)
MVEIRSVNNRYLEISVNLPSFLASLEPEIKSRASAVAARGKVEITVRLLERRENLEIHVDHRAVCAARDALTEIGRIAGVDAGITFADILAFDGIVQTERRYDAGEYRDELLGTLDEALTHWNETRVREGQSTARDINSQIARIRESLRVFSAHGKEGEQEIYRSVREKFREILGDDVEEQRVYTEAAALALRHGTNEEEVRLRSHLDAFTEVLAVSGQPIGKRLDFICQEMNREINTTGSKTYLPVVQAAVIEAKDAVESVREQVRNIE